MTCETCKGTGTITVYRSVSEPDRMLDENDPIPDEGFMVKEIKCPDCGAPSKEKT